MKTMNAMIFPRRKGSISLFLVIVIPMIIMGGFWLYDTLYLRHRDEKALKIVCAVSEARLSRYNEFLKREYALFAHLEQSDFSECVDFYMDQNGYFSNTEAISYDLGTPRYFLETVIRSGRGMFAEQVLETILEKLGLMDVKEGIYSKFEAAEQKMESISEALSLPESLQGLAGNSDFSEVADILTDAKREMDESLVAFEEKREEMFREFQDLGEMGDEMIRNAEQAKGQFKEQAQAVLELLEDAKEAAGMQKRVEDLTASIADLERRLELPETSPSELEALDEALHSLRGELEEASAEFQEAEADLQARIEEALPASKIDLFDDFIAMIRRGAEKLAQMFSATVSEGKVLDPSEDYTLKSCESTGNLLDKITVIEWGLRVFGSYAEDGAKEERAIRGELEYLVSGAFAEDASLASVKMKILGIRMIPNFMTFLKTSVRTEADLAVAAVPPPFTFLAKGALYAALVLGESYLDVEALLRGETFPFFKPPSSWRLSVEGLLQSEFDALTDWGSEEKEGAGYVDYLRILLYLQDDSLTVLRAMNLISAALKEKDYTLESFSVGHEMDVRYLNQSAVTKRESHIHYENSFD